MRETFDENRGIKNARQLIAFLLLSCQSINTMANVTDDAKSFAEQLHSQGYHNEQNTINTMQQGCVNQAQNQYLQPQACELQTLFEGHYDTGDKEDILKSELAKKNNTASQLAHPNQPTLGDAEKLLKEKHRFHISTESDVFKKYQTITKTVVDDKSQAELFEKGSKSIESKFSLEDRIVTCRKGISPELRSCVKKLVAKAVPQPNLVKTVTAYFTARCWNEVTFGINLKTGKINVLYCQNPGSQNLSVDNPIGEPDYPEKTTVQLISSQHIGDDDITFGANLKPSYVNGFSGSFNAGRMYYGILHDDLLDESNKNRVKGGRYVWKVTMPQKPILQEYWVGCEALETQKEQKICEEVFSEQQNLNETRVIAGFDTPVTRAYWSQNKEFLCGGRDIDTCEPYIQQKCEQIDSKCAVFEGNTCVEYENTFRCHVPDYQKTDGLSFNEGQLSFLQGRGQSASQGYGVSDFGEAVAGFSALTEMGKTLEDGLGGIIGDPNNPTVFRGQCRQCRVNLGSFVRDCCKLKGVLQGLLGKCNEEEKKLAIAAVKNKRCIKIDGRYCHKKVAKVCVETRDSYCCYGSQLAKIIHEIANQQLGISMGDAEHPVCNGLTANQLSQLNFDTPFAQQKLAEILGEVQASAQDKFNRVQQAVSAAKSIQMKAVDWEKKQKEIEMEVKHRTERQKHLNPATEQTP